MSLELETLLSNSVDLQVEQLLAEWRKERQLSPVQIERIRQRILETPEEPSFAWWESYINYLNTWLAQADRSTPHFSRGINRASAYRYRRSHKPTVRLRITPDWQPYLKLV